MATDFYMTLPSNASMKMHPDNTLTHYVTALPQRIDLTGEWECGLAEVQYPHTWYNVTENDVWFFLNTIDAADSSRRSKLSCGYYDDPLTLLYHVNKGLYSMQTEETQAQMSYSSVTQKMTLHMTANTLFTVPYHIPRSRGRRRRQGLHVQSCFTTTTHAKYGGREDNTNNINNNINNNTNYTLRPPELNHRPDARRGVRVHPRPTYNHSTEAVDVDRQ